jgi:hypothetical protein
MTKEEMHDAIMNQTNWTTLTLRQLAGAGRIVPGPIVDSWTDEWFFSETREEIKNRYAYLKSLRAMVQETVAKCNL